MHFSFNFGQMIQLIKSLKHLPPFIFIYDQVSYFKLADWLFYQLTHLTDNFVLTLENIFIDGNEFFKKQDFFYDI